MVAVHWEFQEGGWSWECISKCTELCIPLDMEHLLWLVLGDGVGSEGPGSWLMMDFLLWSVFPSRRMKSFIPGPPSCESNSRGTYIITRDSCGSKFSGISCSSQGFGLTGVQFPLFCLKESQLPCRTWDSFWSPLAAEGCWKPGLGLRQSGPWLPAFPLWVREGVQDKP